MANTSTTADDLAEFEDHESNVRDYCRRMPILFSKAANAFLWDANGKRYIDFLAACGSLNYGHNHPHIKAAAVDYLQQNGVLNGLDLHTEAKLSFIRAFRRTILEPRRMNYRLQFTGPTGANAVEAALKLARKVTGRKSVVAFTNAFHGMTLGALAVTGSTAARHASRSLLDATVRLPFDGYHGAGIADLERFEAIVLDPSGGIDAPAAIIVEVVQGEGGLNVASPEWLRRLAQVAHAIGALLIVDDIQAGCGRTGPFFSFEGAGIDPDLICLSKSLSGLGLPMSLLLVRPDRDLWNPGEHNGTFRGNNLAFVTATAALDLWEDVGFVEAAAARSEAIKAWAQSVAEAWPLCRLEIKGRGMMLGIRCSDGETARGVAAAALERALLIETAGPHDEVVKIMPPLTIEQSVLDDGLQRLREAFAAVLGEAVAPAKAA
jgi:diaminobutyrate-2-oxoglutarate transaminase